MFPDIWRRTVRGCYRSTGARASKFARREMIGQGYPAMVPDARRTVEGILYLEVESDDIPRLDRFEGEHYRREAIFVTSQAGGAPSAHVYIFVRTEPLKETLWCEKDFNREQFFRTFSLCDESGF